MLAYNPGFLAMIKKLINGIYECCICLYIYIYVVFLLKTPQTESEQLKLFWYALVPDYKQNEYGTVNLSISIEEPLAVRDSIYAMSFYLIKEELKEEAKEKGYSIRLYRLLTRAIYKDKPCAICLVGELTVVVDWDDFVKYFYRIIS